MFERFTERARQVVVLAQEEARSVLKHNYIGTEHILLGLLRVNEGVAVRVLGDCDADPVKLRTELIALAGTGDRQVSGQTTSRGQATSSGPGPELDPGWLEDLPVLLKPLGAWIRADLGRPPDVGDLLLAIVCVPHTPAAEALDELGIDLDELSGGIERARARDRTDSQVLAQRMTEVTLAKQLAIEEQRFDEAAALRDQERVLREQARALQRARINATYELCQRLGVRRSPDDP